MWLCIPNNKHTLVNILRGVLQLQKVFLCEFEWQELSNLVKTHLINMKNFHTVKSLVVESLKNYGSVWILDETCIMHIILDSCALKCETVKVKKIF